MCAWREECAYSELSQPETAVYEFGFSIVTALVVVRFNLGKLCNIEVGLFIINVAHPN